MDLSTESDCHFMLSKILYVRWEEFEIFLLRNTQVVLGIQSSLRWGWQGGTAAVAMTMAGSLQRHCTRFKSNPCKSQNPVQCSKNSDKIPNHLLISNLKKHRACKKGMQVVKESTSARDEIQKHNAQEFFREPPIFWKTTCTVHYRQGRILCSGQDRLSVQAKILNPCCHPIPQNAEEWQRCQGRERVSAKYPHQVHFTTPDSQVWWGWVANRAVEESLHSPLSGVTIT